VIFVCLIASEKQSECGVNCLYLYQIKSSDMANVRVYSRTIHFRYKEMVKICVISVGIEL
jgi:hypothetical protein